MKKLILSVVVALGATLTASAFPIKIGPVVGVNINSVNINSGDFASIVKDNLSSSNRCGITAGVMAKFTAPIINVGVDVSALYEYRSTEITVPGGTSDKLHYNYIAVPIHVRYDVPMPVISQYFYPTVFTGPNLAFNVGNNIVKEFKANKCNIGWDFGVGVTLMKHLQVSAAYTLGISKAITSPLEKVVNKVSGLEIPANKDAGIKGKTSGWTITAAYLF